MIRERHVKLADEAARAEIGKYGLPTLQHYQLSYSKAVSLASTLRADVNTVKVGIALIDYKLGQAFQERRLDDHVEMSVTAARDLFQGELVDSDLEIVLNCIAAHHGRTPFRSLEAEICANADCYRFIHPAGLLHYLGTLGKRDLAPEAALDQAEAKLEEKWALVTLEPVRSELGEYHRTFKSLFKEARAAQ